MFPFADDTGGRLSRRRWLFLVATFACLHVTALSVSQWVGAFRVEPNSDHAAYLWEILERGVPTPNMWPPAFSYYLAFKWMVTDFFGVPYWSAKYFIDILFVIAGGMLSVKLAQLLTRNAILSMASGIVLVGAPIYAFGSAIEEAAVFFVPVFLASLILLVRELQRESGPRLSGFFASGLLMGVATQIRANPQYIVLVLFPWVLLALRGRRHALRQGATLMGAFLVGQLLPMLPWALYQRHVGQSGASPFGNLYGIYYAGIRHSGGRIGQWLADHYYEPPRTLASVLSFNLHWLKEDPLALLQLYVMKFLRTWYVSDSHRWDTPTLVLHLPIWMAAGWGALRWRRIAPRSMEHTLLWVLIIYFWTISAVTYAIARYTIPLYGFIGILCGVALLPLINRAALRK